MVIYLWIYLHILLIRKTMFVVQVANFFGTRCIALKIKLSAHRYILIFVAFLVIFTLVLVAGPEYKMVDLFWVEHRSRKTHHSCCNGLYSYQDLQSTVYHLVNKYRLWSGKITQNIRVPGCYVHCANFYQNYFNI